MPLSELFVTLFLPPSFIAMPHDAADRLREEVLAASACCGMAVR